MTKISLAEALKKLRGPLALAKPDMDRLAALIHVGPVTHWSQIPFLPWAGNAAADMPLFEAVAEYEESLPNTKRGAKAKEISGALASYYGMGEDCTS